MNYIEKLFKQYPFIYHIGERYYAFGSGVCTECGTSSLSLERSYKTFEENLNLNLTQKEAWNVFHKLVFEAENVREKCGFCDKPQTEILKFSFDEKEMNELKSQIERYIDYWQKYSLKDFV